MTRFEDTLRARSAVYPETATSRTLARFVSLVEMSTAERDALADAIEALRKAVASGALPIREHDAAKDALARLDGDRGTA